MKRVDIDVMPVPPMWLDPTKDPRKTRAHLPRISSLLECFNARGCVLIPGARGEKRPAGAWKQITQSAELAAFDNTDQMGVLTGPSNLCVIDIDVKDSGLETWNALVESAGLVDLIKEHVPHEMTTTGGFHFYFRNPASGSLSSRAKIPIVHHDGRKTNAGIDVRGQGGYVRCAPSAHIAGGSPAVIQKLTWLNSPSDYEFPPLPEALDRILRQQDMLHRSDDGTYTIKPANMVPRKRVKVAAAVVPAVADDQPEQAGLPEHMEEEEPHIVPAVINDQPEQAGLPEHKEEQEPHVRVLVMECLAQRRAEVRDDWLRVLLALANEDHSAGKRGRYLQLCKDFSQRTGVDNLASNAEIEQIYRDAEAKVAKHPVTMGTIKKWAREDNAHKYDQVIDAFPTLVVNAFDDSEYYWYDFCREATAKVWDSFQSFLEFCQSKMRKVLAIVARTPAVLISKHSKNERYNIFERLNPMYSFEFRWRAGQAKDGSTVYSSMHFTQFLKQQHMKFHCFQEFDVDPSGVKDHRTVFNIWPGLRARLLPRHDEEKIKPFQELLKLWSQGDESTYKYLQAWFKFLVAHPDRKANVALVVTGLEGSGKSILCEFLRDFVLGPTITAFFDGVEDMTEKHNCRKGGKRLWVLEECRSTRDEFIHTMDSLKRLITNPIVSENPKGMPIREVQNIGMMIILSNHVDCINVTSTDRRYSFIPTSPERRGVEHRNWWAELRQSLLQEDTGDHVYTWLLSLEGLPDPTVPLENSMRARVQEMSKAPARLFVEYYLHAVKDPQWWTSKAHFYQAYRHWCQRNGHTTLSASRFHGKVEHLSTEQPSLNFKPHRHQNQRGYAPRDLPVRGANIVEQGLTWYDVNHVDFNML